MAARCSLLLLYQLLLMTEAVTGDIVIERTSGVNPDRFTLRTNSCIDSTAADLCGGYGGKSAGGNNCECVCTESNNTFSLLDLRCIKTLAGCNDLQFTSEGHIFTFNSVSSELYPRLPVRRPSSSTVMCLTENLNVTYQEKEMWRQLTSGTVNVTTTQNTANSFIEVDELSLVELYGKLVRVAMSCSITGAEMTRMCLTFKLNGQQEALPDVTTTLAQNRKIEASIFYWVAGGCIGVLILAGVLGLTMALTFRARNRRRKPDLKVDRVDHNGNTTAGGHKPTQISRNGGSPRQSPRRSTQNGHPRTPLYAKNPNRDQNKKYEQQKTVTIAQSEREIISNRSTPRTPRPASQNSATFVVNENDPPMRNRSLTDTAPTLRGSYHFVRKEDEQKALDAAKIALTEFEGVRVTKELQHQNGLVLFNEKYQRLSNLQALQAMNGPESPESKKAKKHTSRIRSERKKNEDVTGSRLSIDYEHFENPSADTSQTSSGVSSGQTDTTASSKPELSTELLSPDQAEDKISTTSDEEEGSQSGTDEEEELREFDIEGLLEVETVGVENHNHADNSDYEAAEIEDTSTDSDSELSGTSSVRSVTPEVHCGSTNLTLIDGKPISNRASSEIIVKFDPDPSEIPPHYLPEEQVLEEEDDPPPVTYIDDLPVTDIDQLILDTDDLDIDQLILDTDDLPHPPDHLLSSQSSSKASFPDLPSTGWCYQPNTAASQWSIDSGKVDTRL